MVAQVSAGSVSHIIGQIYDAAHQQTSLASAMGSLARLFSASRACLLRMGPDDDGFDAVASADDLEDFVRLDPDTLRNDSLLCAMQSLPVGRIASRDELIDERTFRRSELWESFFRRREMEIGWTCKLRSSGTTGWFLDLQRSSRQGPLDDAELRLLREILPHFERASRISEQLDNGIGIADGLSQLALGLVLVDANRRILRMNSAASALLERSDAPLQAKASTITAVNPGDDRILARLVAQCCAGATGAVPRAGGAMLVMPELSAQPSPPLILSVSPCAGMHAFGLGPAPRAVIAIHEAVASHRPDFGQRLRTLFGLSAIETKIATGLASGLTLKQAAEQSAEAGGAARAHLREIFRKTNTRHQGQLIALISAMQPLSLK